MDTIHFYIPTELFLKYFSDSDLGRFYIFLIIIYNIHRYTFINYYLYQLRQFNCLIFWNDKKLDNYKILNIRKEPNMK